MIQRKTMVNTMRTQKKTNNFRNKPKGLFIVLICWAFPMAWVAAIPDMDKREQRKLRESSLTLGKVLINKFSTRYKTVPQNLNELRAFALVEKSKFVPWDRYGQRLDYLRLSQKSWYLRSFGKDGHQNTLMTKQDLVESSFEKETSRGVLSLYSSAPTRFNPVLLSGSLSHKGNWQARLYLDKSSGASRLLIRHRKKKDYFLISNHNTVEEFYWLPDGYRIVFTATGSNRYKDGIYLWNLLSDRVSQIYPEFNNYGSTDSSQQHKFWNFTLAGIDESPAQIFAFASPKLGQPLNLENLYTQDHLIKMVFPTTSQPKIINKVETIYDFSPLLSSGWSGKSMVKNCQQGSKTQKTWCNLPTVGVFQDIIESWQTYAQNHSSSPTFAYSLMQLSSIYSDSYQLLLEQTADQTTQQLNNQSGKNAEILKSYGIEIASALMNLSNAPTWLRSSAWFTVDQLSQNKALPYRFSKLSIRKEEKQNSKDSSKKKAIIDAN
jgi:hypothetical protein